MTSIGPIGLLLILIALGLFLVSYQDKNIPAALFGFVLIAVGIDLVVFEISRYRLYRNQHQG